VAKNASYLLARQRRPAAFQAAAGATLAGAPKYSHACCGAEPAAAKMAARQFTDAFSCGYAEHSQTKGWKLGTGVQNAECRIRKATALIITRKY